MITLSSHLLSSKLAEDLCAATGATYQPLEENGSVPGYRIAFPPQNGRTPCITVKSSSTLDDLDATVLTFYLTLTATDIHPLLQTLLVFIRMRRKLNDQQEESIISALHEALINAIIHGNLGAQSNYNDAYKMFDHFEAIGEVLLNTPAPKIITLQIEFSFEAIIISVTDQGKGFCEQSMLPPGEKALHGRGMAIIRECCDTVDITDGGRTIIMRFASNIFFPNTPSPILHSHILIIEDVAVNRAIIHQILKRKGFNHVSIAIDGLEAYQKTLQLKPDIVLLDLVLPHMDGYEYCRKIRQLPEFKDTPIVVQTVLSSEEQRSKAFACGASDLVTKPINAYELVARLTLHLERQEMLRNLRTYQQRVQLELESARAMQESILPGEALLQECGKRYSIEIHSLFQTSSEIGGDIWGIRQISDTECAIYIADFSGHGVTAALNAFRLQAILQNMTTELHAPSFMLQELNRRLYGLLEPGQFATMFYAVIDIGREQISYAAAGSPNPALIRGQKKVEWLHGIGLPLGAHEKTIYPTHFISFCENDSLFLYSDALIETQNTKGEFFTPEILESCLPAKNPRASFQNITQKFHGHWKGMLADDLTMVIFSRQRVK